MIIKELIVLSGANCPDPTYTNLYDYRLTTDQTLRDDELPYMFFRTLRQTATLPELSIYKVPSNGGTFYPLSESVTGVTIEIPTDDGFPASPKYIIFKTGAKYRYAFVMDYTRTSESKIRASCLWDQWTEHFTALMSAEMSFTRNHRDRYGKNLVNVVYKKYNGLADPVPQGMVQGSKYTVPVPANGTTTATVSGNTHYYVPVWIYFRVATNDLYVLKEGGDPNVDSDYDRIRLSGMDVPKGGVPVFATCVGCFDVSSVPGTQPVFLPLQRIYVRDGDVLYNTVTITPAAVMTWLTYGHPYFVQSYITTIPPVDCSIAPRRDPAGGCALTTTDHEFRLVGRYTGDGHTYVLGSLHGGLELATNGLFLNMSIITPNPVFSPGDVHTHALTSDVVGVSPTIDPAYEPKIEEAPYEGTELKLYGADIDISPTAAISGVDLIITTGAHNDVYLVSNGTEIYRASGICSQFGRDSATDSLTNWLLTNYNTYQNARLFKGINAGASFGLGMAGALMSGNILSGISALVQGATTAFQIPTSEIALKRDLQSSPNSATIPSENGVDNFPLLDLPVLTKRKIPSAVKNDIMRYWHVYGYPDNRTGTLSDIIEAREYFNYVQASLISPLPNTYPAECESIVNAFRSGVWIWHPVANDSVFVVQVEPPTIPPTYYTIDGFDIYKTSPRTSLDNMEVSLI